MTWWEFKLASNNNKLLKQNLEKLTSQLFTIFLPVQV